MGISINQLSRDLFVPPNRISEIVNGKRSITADTVLLVSSDLSFGIARQHQAFIDKNEELTHIFRDLEEAIKWLEIDIDYDELNFS